VANAQREYPHSADYPDPGSRTVRKPASGTEHMGERTVNRPIFVRDSKGTYWLQKRDDSIWGFALVTEDGLTFPDGFGSGAECRKYVRDEEVSPEVRQRFAWIIATEVDLLC